MPPVSFVGSLYSSSSCFFVFFFCWVVDVVVVVPFLFPVVAKGDDFADDAGAFRTGLFVDFGSNTNSSKSSSLISMVFVFIVGLGVREDVRAGAFAFVIFSLFLWVGVWHK